MSQRPRSNSSGAMGKIVDKLKRTIADQDDPLQQGYQRVFPPPPNRQFSRSPQRNKPAAPQPGGSGASEAPLETVVLDTNLISLDNQPIASSPPSRKPENPFSVELPTPPVVKKPTPALVKDSRVSFEDNFGDEEQDTLQDFNAQRAHFQKFKSQSSAKRLLLNDIHHLINTDARRQFQSKKHVSLDPRSAKQLQQLLRKDESSEDEFENTRKQFQARKHKSLDARHIRFAVEKEETSTESDEDTGERSNLLKVDPDITKPFIVDLKDLDTSSDDEDLAQQRREFQASKHISVESKRSIRFFEMDDLNDKEERHQARPLVRQVTLNGSQKLEIYRPTENPIYYYSQIIAAIAVSLGSMVVGFSSAYTSPALVSMTDRNITSFDVSEQAKSWIGGLMPLAGLAGGVCGGPFIEYLGRRNTILATSIPFIISGLLIACAVDVGMVLAGRALSGFCVGIASLSLPVYLGETLQPEVRGTLGLLPTAFGNIGILICFVAGKYMNWSELAYLGAALPVPFLILMFLIPETPRWYVSKGKEPQARKALQWLRGKQANIEPELKGVMKSHSEAEKSSSGSQIFELLKRQNLKPLSISLGLMFFQQLSGINAVIFYTTSIFKSAGSTIDESLCTIIVGIVNFIAVFIATVLIDRLGRKILLYISDAAMILTLATLGAFFYLKSSGHDVENIGWLPLASFVIFVVGFSLGFGPIPWLMMGEILPARIRGSAASVATGFNWLCTFVVTKTFVDMVATIGSHGAFWLFGSFCVCSLFFVIFYVPETQGQSLEDIERKMLGRVRRMSSVANLKPMPSGM
ncbi:facilitated trehalose transporter Tret1-like isoform X2 [Culicoides brevitarsis]|uniref:facilitated trehalose transporter Tret1-like isoform X2 n=1 Tax=Culicoides brevitarsis TaxID=469753 RepID=UPI00307BE197